MALDPLLAVSQPQKNNRASKALAPLAPKPERPIVHMGGDCYTLNRYGLVCRDDQAHLKPRMPLVAIPGMTALELGKDALSFGAAALFVVAAGVMSPVSALAGGALLFGAVSFTVYGIVKMIRDIPESLFSLRARSYHSHWMKTGEGKDLKNVHQLIVEHLTEIHVAYAFSVWTEPSHPDRADHLRLDRSIGLIESLERYWESNAETLQAWSRAASSMPETLNNRLVILKPLLKSLYVITKADLARPPKQGVYR